MRRKEYKQLRKLQRGDSKIFKVLCEKYYEQFLRYALSALKSQSIAESVLKDTMLEIWQNRHSLDPNVAFSIQIFQVLERRVFEKLHSIIFDDKLEEEIRSAIVKEYNIQPDTILDKEQASIIEAIHNEILQRKLLHELATTRR